MELSKINNNLVNGYIKSDQKEKIETESFEDSLIDATAKQDAEALKEACREFEAYFVQQLFKEMRSTVHDGGLISKSQGQEIFEEMLYDEYANESSKGKGIGIADMMYKQLSNQAQAMYNKINKSE